MKTVILFLMVLFLIGCDQVSVRRIIPKENIAKADSFIIRQMQTIKIIERYENEDYDDFLLQAKENALELYGVDTLGIYGNIFIPFDKCTPEQKTELRERMEEPTEGEIK